MNKDAVAIDKSSIEDALTSFITYQNMNKAIKPICTIDGNALASLFSMYEKANAFFNNVFLSQSIELYFKLVTVQIKHCKDFTSEDYLETMQQGKELLTLLSELHSQVNYFNTSTRTPNQIL